MIGQSTIDEIKTRMDIVEVVSDFVELKKSGSSYKALSPFTSEKTPSFFVVPSKGIFKCFSSGKGGDSITFVMEVDGLSYVEALKYLAEKYSIEIEEEEQTDEQLEAQNKRESLYIITNFAAEYFQKLLLENEEGKSIGLSYFKEREISDDSIEKFKLGYSLNVWDGFHKAATEGGFNEDLIEEAGLIIRKEERFYDRFRGRVIFPIQNITGKVIAFGARILVSDKKQPKYLNSPETELYNKSQVLYGLYQAKQAIRLKERCILVEGYTDVISLHQAGVENVVSSSGTALTEDQVKLIRRYTENVTVIFDGDSAGLKASFRGIDILLNGGLNVKAITLPEGEDPDSYSKSLGTTAFQHFIEKDAQDFIAFKTSVLLADVKNDPVKKAEVVKEIVESISLIDDAIKRSLYIKECSRLMEISESVLIVEQNKVLLEKNKKPKNLATRKTELLPEDLVAMPIADEQVETLDIGQVIANQEKESIRVLVNYGNELLNKNEEDEGTVLKYFLAESEELAFTHPVYNRILQVFKERDKDGLETNTDHFMSMNDPEIQSTVVDLIAPRYEISEFWKSKYEIIVPHEIDNIKHVSFTNILRLKFWFIQHLIEQKSEELKGADTQKIDEILDEINEMKQIEVEIAKFLGNVTVK